MPLFLVIILRFLALYFFYVATVTGADGAADAHNFKPDTAAAMHGSVINADFSGVQLIQFAIFALGYVRHNHIGAALQSH